jgi:macrolide-specific efflux system membrane fusion protein
MKKLLLAIVVIAVLAGGGAAAWAVFSPSSEPAAPPTQAVTRGNIEETVLASGSLQANSVVSVAAEVSGQIETLHVAIGDRVERGDLIAEIDSLDQQNAVKIAEAELANIVAQRRAREAEVVNARQALERAEQLSAQNLVPVAEYQSAQATLQAALAAVDSLDAQISQAELSVELAELDLSRTRITAPASGTIVAVLTGEGQTINANQSAPIIVKIADLDTMIIEAQISEADVTKVRPGLRVYFSILGEPDKRYEATLRSIEPAPEAIATNDSGIDSADGAIYYNGLFEVDNPDRLLRIAMTAQVTIIVAEAQDALLVPSGAVSTGPEGRTVVAVYDPATETVTPQPVEIGLDNNIQAEVLSGLEKGDLVVAAGAFTMSSDGNRSGGVRMGGMRFGG